MIFSDSWFGMVATAAKDYSILIAIVSSGVAAGLKIWAIRHPEIKDNKIYTLVKSWVFGLPVVGSALEAAIGEETEGK